MSAGELKPCRGCGKDIMFGFDTDSGKWIPLDPAAQVYKVDPRGRVEKVPVGYMVTHFATCAAANQFSGKNKKETPRADIGN